MKLSVIIPVYNEKETLKTVIDAVKNVKLDIEMVIVNDCSTDGSTEILNQLQTGDNLKIIHHEVNKGKGAAIRTALQATTGDAVVIQDADLEYDPQEFVRSLSIIKTGQADAVYGSRYSGTELLVDSFWHYMGNKFLTFLSNFCCNLHLTDMETCHKMIKGDLFRSMKLECNRFGIEPEITAKLAKLEVNIYEVPIKYKARRFDEGKKIGWKDGVAAIWYILKYNFLSR